MPVSASGFLSLRLTGVETLLANTATFKSWTNTATATLAKAHIYIPSNESISSSTKPFAVITDAENETLNRIADNGWIVNADVMILIYNNPGTGLTTDRDIYLDTLNKIGAIIEEMLALQGTDDGTTQFVSLSSITKVAGPMFQSNVEEGHGEDYMITAIAVTTGF